MALCDMILLFLLVFFLAAPGYKLQYVRPLSYTFTRNQQVQESVEWLNAQRNYTYLKFCIFHITHNLRCEVVPPENLVGCGISALKAFRYAVLAYRFPFIT